MSGIDKNTPLHQSQGLQSQQKHEKPKDPDLQSSTLQNSHTSWNPLQGFTNRLKMMQPMTGDQELQTKLIQPMKDMTPQFPVYQGMTETFTGRYDAMQRLYQTHQFPMVKPFMEKHGNHEQHVPKHRHLGNR